MSWARRKETDLKTGPEPKAAAEVLARGDVVYVVERDGNAQLVQVPEAEAAIVALDPNDGAIAALVGGFDYFDKGFGKFNRVTQAKRQPGSGFKPFLYSAALENGFTPSSVIMDSPFIIDDPRMEEAWRPENSSGQFYGPTRLREALVKSRNLVSIRILQAIGTKPVINHATRFGFPRGALPREPDAGARHAAGDAAGGGERLRGVRQRRLPRAAVLHRAHRGSAGQGGLRGEAEGRRAGVRGRRRRARTPWRCRRSRRMPRRRSSVPASRCAAAAACCRRSRSPSARSARRTPG